MAKKKIEMLDLMEATQELLLEKGYEGFHFKLLSERLGVGRSTIYEYVSNKDELILVYMNHVMKNIMEKLPKAREPIAALKELLLLFLTHSHMHQILQVLPLIDAQASPRAEALLAQLNEDHRVLFAYLMQQIGDAQQRGVLRDDIPDQLIASFFFQSIQLPPMPHVTLQEWSELVFRLLYEGIRKES